MFFSAIFIHFDDENEFDATRFADSLRASRPISPKDCAEAIAEIAGWGVDARFAKTENAHLEQAFTIKSNNLTYPVFISGLVATMGDYYHNPDPLLIGLIESLKKDYEHFIFLTGEGSTMFLEEGNTHYHLMGVVHKDNITSLLFLSAVEPDDQHGQYNIDADRDLPDWAIIESENSYKYTIKVGSALRKMFEGIQLTH